MTHRERAPNRLLAALMRDANIGNKGLARRMRDLSSSDGGEPIAPSHTNVDKWLSGETQRPKDRTCHVLVKVLERALGRPVSLNEVGYGDVAPEGSDTTLKYAATPHDSVVALTQLTDYELRPEKQTRQLHIVPEAWSSLLATWLFGTASGENKPFEPHSLSEIDIQAVHEATVMFANFDYRYGGGRPKPLVATYLEGEVLPQLAMTSPTTPLGKAYFREVAALTRLAGWTCYDTGQHALAQRYLWHAFRLAQAAGDKPLCGRILAGMSHQANFLGHFEQAVQLARAAAHGAADNATPTAMALFHAMEARALSSQRNEHEATAALLAAEEFLSDSQPENDPGWIHYFDSAELHAEFAHCFRDLQKPELATHHALSSIQESENLYVRSLSFCRTVLAESHIQSGELEQSVAVAKEVVDTAAHLKSSRVLAYLANFRARLSQQDDGRVLHEFTDYLSNQLALERTPVSD